MLPFFVGPGGFLQQTDTERERERKREREREREREENGNRVCGRSAGKKLLR